MAEANAIRSQKRRNEFFELQMTPKKSVLGYVNSSDDNAMELSVVELVKRDGDLLGQLKQARTRVARGLVYNSRA